MLAAHDGQLARYFNATKAEISILTNGIVSRFFTDLEVVNNQDKEPFFVFDCTNPTKTQIDFLEMFTADKFDIKSIKEWAAEHQFATRVKVLLTKIIASPAEVPGFIKYLLDQTPGFRNKNALRIMTEKLPGLMNDVLGDAVKNKFSTSTTASISAQQDGPNMTTEEEIQAFIAIQHILVGAGKNADDIIFKDEKNYMNICYKTKANWFLRLFFNETIKGVQFRLDPNEIALHLPKATVVLTKNGNPYVNLVPKEIGKLSKAIVVTFEGRATQRLENEPTDLVSELIQKAS